MAYGISLHVWGDWALFSRPEMKVERVSYDVITPSAARGIVSAIYWKPEIAWIIDRIRVLKPIHHTSMRRNEVGEKIPRGAVASAMRSGRGNLGLYVEDIRQQRAGLMLRNVSYIIDAHFKIISGDDNEAKHLDQFNRRARVGQCFQRPCLGTRECAADFALIEGPLDPALDQLPLDQRNRDFGWMLHDIDFANGNQPRFYHAVMNDGIIQVPAFDSAEVRA